MQADVAAACGPKGMRNPAGRGPARHRTRLGGPGSHRTQVVRPRMRAAEGPGRVPVADW